jgi:hypothetical protein
MGRVPRPLREAQGVRRDLRPRLRVALHPRARVVRCSLLRPDPVQRPRLEEIRLNLLARIFEAEREGWLGEVEGLKVSLAGAEDKIAQVTASLARKADAVQLGMPTFPDIAGRAVPGPASAGPGPRPGPAREDQLS